MRTLDIITAVKDTALGSAAIVTAIVAYRGLRKWREELRGRVDFKVARGLIRATYRLGDKLRAARSPFVSASEFPSTYRSPGNATTDEEARALAQVFKHRWEPIVDALQEFEAQALEAEAL